MHAWNRRTYAHCSKLNLMPEFWIRRSFQFLFMLIHEEVAYQWTNCNQGRAVTGRGCTFLLLERNCGFQLLTLLHWKAMADDASSQTLPNTTFVFRCKTVRSLDMGQAASLCSSCCWVHYLSTANGTLNGKASPLQGNFQHSCSTQNGFLKKCLRTNAWNLWICNIIRQKELWRCNLG